MILGEDELASGQVKIKEMGLPEGHPEKEGVLVEIKKLVDEVKLRIDNYNNKATATASAVTDATAAVADLSVKTEDAGV